MPGQPFWSSNNIARVWSRGLSPRLSFSRDFNQLQLRFGLGYDWVRSTSQKTISKPQFEKGEQLWYVPIHRAWAWLLIGNEHWQLRYQHQYTGATQGIIESLDHFDIGQLEVRWLLAKASWRTQVFGRIDNLWDTSYRIIERRPMPSRQFNIGLQFQLESAKNQLQDE